MLTYLYEKEDLLLARFAAGNIIGSAILATVGFVLACFFGLSALTVTFAILLTLSPLLLFSRKSIKHEFRRDWQRAKGKMQGASVQKALRFFYYLGVFMLLWFFFERAMIETENGILTGGSQNLGDLPFHLGAIFSFTEGNNFPPENPSFAGAKFTYPFLADFVTACLMKFGANVREAMLIQNVFLGFSLVVLLEKFTVKLTENKFAGKIAPMLLLLSGGLGFIWFFKDYWEGSQSFFDILSKLPRDYTIGDPPTGTRFRWGNSLVVLFLTQRSLLFGMPLMLIALTKLWDIFNRDRQDKQDNKTFSFSPRLLISSSPFIVGLLAGTLPLIHVHSLAVLFVVCAFLFFFRMDKWREWIAFGIGVSIIAIPELIFALTGSASNLKEFIGWHFGWDSKNENFLFFWAKNLGLFIPLLAVGIYLIYVKFNNSDDTKIENQKSKIENLLFFYIPFAFLFLVSNTVKLAPWEWDNIKVLIYWFIGSIPFVAFALAWFWEKNNALLKILAAGCFLVLTLSGALDVWRTISGQINYNVFSADSVKTAEIIRQKTAPNALFLNAPTYNSAVVLTGRRSLMRYSGHLSSYGIDYSSRENEVKRIYEGGSLANSFLEKNNIEYVIISPEESGNLTVNEEFFYKYQIITEFGGHKVFKIK